MKPHKHAELIKAWADGAEIEYRMIGTEKWVQLDIPSWFADEEYRIKPEQKPDEVHFYQALFDDLDAHRVNADYANLKLTFDGETGELKSAEMLK
jgi:hypothetical protein